MRVVAGKRRGKKLEGLSTSEMRPTTDKVKESIFNVIQFRIEGKVFLDLFAGSGQMGIEALSRGAKGAIFVDCKKSSIDIIKKNIKSCGFSDNSIIINQDFLSYLKSTSDHFDIAFLDPPYKAGILEDALKLAEKRMNKDGVIICECPFEKQMPQEVGNFILYKKYQYGKIAVLLYLDKEEDIL